MRINQETAWEKRQAYLNEMYKNGKKPTNSQWDAISDELSVRTVHAMSGYKEEGINIKTVIGDADSVSSMVCDAYIQPEVFTSWGKLSTKGLARLLETLKKKYKIHIQISCIR